ncbi:hypothetical protein KC315_g9867 [Hortaea werneckii]|uniref:Uncharacterized protein n=1 Tax=Hortaea werneckii TaxID=91943 RepID=A0A3M7DNP7_HORWE|nr:hypothetical protein KC315_g9867 [Hortaea werneckii]KAI7354334.1 hypothetical protein KC354_g11173 [Hortaea werneckii]RMY65657.1 hypothetical protein D0863_08967 [Hortaea werneckii]
MAEAKYGAPPRPPTTTTGSSSNNIPQTAGVRYRLPQRKTSSQNLSPSPHPPELLRRRSSILSYSSIEDATQSFADNILDPKTGRRRNDEESEVTHWHSTPLAFAILPGLAGLLFKNGSAFVTDALLLGLAAIFMNWSIRLPWDWYYSAQSVREELEPATHNGTIPEEGEGSENAVDTGSSGAEGESQVRPSSARPKLDRAQTKDLEKRVDASADLRKQELLALLATFIFPALSAYLLHVIRAQLSRPSTGLVSDYNLSIFFLAAEIKPCRQLARLVANRTLHLQRTVTGLEDPFASTLQDKSTIADLTNRITDLEAKMSEHNILPQTISLAQKTDVHELSAELRKRYEPRIDGLERAVRRYEKRTVALTMATEARLQQLETQLQDALSLAAVAAQHNERSSPFRSLWETTVAIIIWPFKTAWNICVWPIVKIEDLYEKGKVLMLGPMPSARAARRRRSEKDFGAEDGPKSRARSNGRKPSR